MAKKKQIDLDALDQNKSISKEVFLKELKKYQLNLLQLQLRLKESNRSVAIVIEGPDAAGKGGAIKRLVECLDPRLVRVYSIVKPTQEEYRHHYMWRFWNKIPAKGELVIFDRSWYGRVLVERVEGFATGREWKQAYQEINEFERTLINNGTIIVKAFMMITKEEQLRRFKARAAEPFKHWKINEEDWRNRRKWKEHNEAATVMFEKTSTKLAPWTIIAANYKWYARVKLAQTVYEKIESELKKG
ncbi:MAG: UDP-galactose-lipid carrier transferase [Chthoniobacterales bacterium]|nr:UDP-galactose-lipid carrier transferase [Chthoniobacterales bacterium]